MLFDIFRVVIYEFNLNTLAFGQVAFNPNIVDDFVQYKKNTIGAVWYK